jgi:hypothetical protein
MVVLFSYSRRVYSAQFVLSTSILSIMGSGFYSLLLVLEQQVVENSVLSVVCSTSTAIARGGYVDEERKYEF